MGNIKRVRDSKKRAVRQGKEQVWLVNGEKVVNTNHGFAEATGTDVVYDGSWEEPQEPLQVYDNGWEEVGGGGSSATLTGLSDSYLSLYQGSYVNIMAYFTPEDADSYNIVASSSNPEAVEVIDAGHTTGMVYFQIRALSSTGSSDIVVTDGNNSYTCSIECMQSTPVASIGSPSESEITIINGNVGKRVTFEYSPTDASNPANDITIDNSGTSYSWSAQNGVFAFDFFYVGSDSDGELSYYLTSDPETVYTITVHNVTPTVAIESLSGVPSEVSHLAPATGRTFQVTYSPADADYVLEQISIQSDTSVVSVGMRNLDTTNHTFLVDYYGVAEGSSYVQFWVGGNIIAQSLVTIEYPAISALSNLQYTNPTADGGEVYSRMSTGATFEYTPTSGRGGLTITQTGGTRVDGTSWDTPDGQDISIGVEEINYNNGTATVYFYVDNEASVGQWGSWRIAVENDPNEYLDVKITYANEPAPVTDCTITVEANDNTMGSVDIPSVTVPFDTSISYNGNQVTIGSTTVTATANTGYQLRGWMNMIYAAIEDSTIMAEFEAETPASTYELSITTTEGTIIDGDGNAVSFPLSVSSGNEISRDGVSFYVRDGGTLLYENNITYNGILGVICDATVNGEPWPTDDETGDPTSVIVEGDITIAASNIEWPTTNIGIDEDGISGTVTRTGNGWVQNDETGLREVQGLVSDTTITPSDNNHTYTLTIDDGQDTNTLEIVPDNFDDYVYRGLDDGLEITQSVNIKDLPGFGETTHVYPATTAATPE